MKCKNFFCVKSDSDTDNGCEYPEVVVHDCRERKAFSTFDDFLRITMGGMQLDNQLKDIKKDLRKC